MSTDLTLQNMNALITMADKLYKSSLLPIALRNKPAEVLQILQMGSELGLKPMQSINSINVIQGKPTISSQLMIALIRQNCPNSFIKIEEDIEKKIVKCTMARDKSEIDQAYTASWNMDKAKAMGMDKKDNYLKQPMTMLKWRAVSEAARFVFPDIIMGCYTPEELDQNDKLVYDQDGGIIGEKKTLEGTVVDVSKEFSAQTIKDIRDEILGIIEYLMKNGKEETREIIRHIALPRFNDAIQKKFPDDDGYKIFNTIKEVVSSDSIEILNIVLEESKKILEESKKL